MPATVRSTYERYLTFTVTELDVWPSTTRTTLVSPLPRKFNVRATFTWSRPANWGCGPAYSTGTLTPLIVTVTFDRELRFLIPVPNKLRKTGVSIPKSMGTATQT